jgi:hypothetical protein
VITRRLAVAGAAIAIVIVSAGPGAAHAATRADVGTTIGSCAKLAGVTTDADGDTVYEFKAADGAVERHFVPAPSFDPAAASTERLQKFGLPARPPATRSAERTEWDAVAAAAKRSNTPQGSCFRTPARATTYYRNYSGYKGTAASGKVYSGVHASYTAPSYYLSTCSQESMTQWVGVSDNDVLVQAGVYVTQYDGSLHSSAFYEVVGGPWDTGHVVDVPSVPYVAGHRYYFNVEYGNRNQWVFVISDLDSGASASIAPIHSGGGTNYLQPIAYVTSERLSYSGTLTQYMNHSDVRFRSATTQISGEGEARLSIQRPDDVIMISPGIGDKRLGNVDPINVSDSSFTEHWARCGVVE